jgi:hypothetical protein
VRERQLACVPRRGRQVPAATRERAKQLMLRGRERAHSRAQTDPAAARETASWLNVKWVQMCRRRLFSNSSKGCGSPMGPYTQTGMPLRVLKFWNRQEAMLRVYAPVCIASCLDVLSLMRATVAVPQGSRRSSALQDETNSTSGTSHWSD